MLYLVPGNYLRHQNGVNHMDHTINGLEGRRSAARVDLLLQLRCCNSPRDDVISKNLGQRILILGLYQMVDGSGGQLIESSLVGAKTVNGPVPSRVSTNTATLTTATSVV